ncbi:MAG: hypothetical protein OXF68_11400 [Gammaproteobacteria bacterium]|nr:hypothetical protein [Gammaproteobacteria bacterium]
MSLLLELNDAALSLYRDGDPIYQQPAIALVGPQGAAFGAEALQRARLQPQQVNQQYLARLNADPLPRPGKGIANHADLVYRHLREIGALADEPLAVAAPGFLTGDQLGVLLGIAEEAGIRIRGFVDSAVLMGSVAELRPNTWLLDLHATRSCLTELRLGDADGQAVSQGTVEDIAGFGRNACLDGWANLVADRFVQDTRFDPLHAADCEQQLYDQLHAWAERQTLSELAVAVRQGDATRQVRIGAAALRDKLMQRLAPVVEKVPAGARLLVAPHGAALPGLVEGLEGLGIEARRLPEDIMARAMAQRLGAVDGLKWVTALPAAAMEPAAANQASAASASAPGDAVASHALCGHRAWPLAGNGFGLPEQGRIGEIIERGGRRFELIAVEDAG